MKRSYTIVTEKVHGGYHHKIYRSRGICGELEIALDTTISLNPKILSVWYEQKEELKSDCELKTVGDFIKL